MNSSISLSHSDAISTEHVHYTNQSNTFLSHPILDTSKSTTILAQPIIDPWHFSTSPLSPISHENLYSSFLSFSIKESSVIVFV